MKKEKKIVYQIWEKTTTSNILKGEWGTKKEALVEYNKYNEFDFPDVGKKVWIILDEIKLEGNKEKGWKVVFDKNLVKKHFLTKKKT